jgi:hypothetical protein
MTTTTPKGEAVILALDGEHSNHRGYLTPEKARILGRQLVMAADMAEKGTDR